MKSPYQPATEPPAASQVAESPLASNKTQQELDPLSDEELTEIFVEETQAFVVLYRRYVDRVFSYFAWRFGRSYAEDLTSDVFTRALKAREKFQQGKAWRPWLFGIARNRALEHGRFRKRDSSESEFNESSVKEHAPDVAVEAELGEQAQAIRKMVASLPEKQREIVELRFWAGLSYREISEILGGSEGSLRVQTHRTLRELRNRLEGAL